MFERSFKTSASAIFQNSKNLHLIGIVGDSLKASQVVWQAPEYAKLWEVTTERWAIAETSEMDDDGYVAIQFIEHGRAYIERIQYPVTVPLAVLENCLDVRSHRRAVMDQKAIEKMPVQRQPIQKKSRFGHYVAAGKLQVTYA